MINLATKCKKVEKEKSFGIVGERTAETEIINIWICMLGYI